MVRLRNDLGEPIRVKSYRLVECENVLGRCGEDVLWRVAVKPGQIIETTVRPLDWAEPARFQFYFEWDKELDDAWSPRPGSKATPPRLMKRIEPTYPETEEIGGVVGVEFVVAEDGNVVELEVTNSVSPAIDAAVLEALKQWKFKPGKLDGKKTRMKLSLPVKFEPPRDEKPD